ncbi:MAG: FixH family protein [Pseudomonadota bacterium]
MTTAHVSTQTNDPAKQLKGWHVLLILLGFFGVMFSVNGVFLYHAITSFPGGDVKKSYVQGLNYNETLADRAEQAALGWRVEAGLQGNEILLRLRDADDNALTHYPIIGELRRMATQDADVAIAFASSQTGEYSVTVDVLSSGQWQLRIGVLDTETDAVLFEAEKTLFVP